MTLFYFGERARPLFGAFHAAESHSARAPAVLICNPFGEEAIRAHRFLRILAERLARAGSPVLRFDYFGSGDAGGEGADVSLAGMVADIETAHEELLDMSGASRAVWLGLRLGASAAALAAGSAPRGLGGLVFWDPVMSGADYLKSLGQAHVAFLASAFDQPAETIERRIGAAALEPQEAMGFEIGDAMRRELQAFNLEELRPRVRSAMVVASRETDAGYRTVLEDAVARVDWCEEADAASWNSDKAMNEYFVPTKTTDMIAAAIGEWR